MHSRRAVAIAAAIAFVWPAISAGPVNAQKPAQPTQPAAPSKKPPSKSCQISASGVDFGIYDTLSRTPTDASGSLTYSCSSHEAAKSQTVVVTIDQGRSGSFDRAMAGPESDQLRYNLYIDVGRTEIWGDGSSGTQVLTDNVPPNGHINVAFVYGRVVPRQNVSAGRYTDGLVVTIQF